MIEAFSAVVPVFLLIGLGVCLDLFRALPENANQTLSLYVLNVALPLLLFQIMATAPLESFAHPQFWLGVIAAQFLIYGVCYAADRILARHDSAAATVTALGGCFCNAAFVGIPVITSALPGNAEALFVAGLFTITPNLLFVVGQVQLAAHDPSRSMPQGRKAVLLHVLRYSLLYNAVFWGMAGGVLVSALGLGLWDPLNRAAELVGHTAAPCMLVTLGLTLRERLAVVLRHAGGHALLRQTALQICKLVVQPLVCWGILAALAGLALACSGLGLWQPLDHAAALIGSTAAPCMLLALGFDLRQKLVLALRRNGGHTVIRQAWLLLCKLGIHPLICWGIMHLAGLPPLWLGVGVLMSATGTALVASVLAEVYSAVPEEAALTAVLSNAASMVSLMLFIFLLQGAGCL